MNTDPTVATLGPVAIGSIGPEPRLEMGEIEQNKLEDVIRRVASGEFHDDIDEERGPCAAGGTFTLVVADALTTRRFQQPGMTAKGHAKAMFSWLIQQNSPALRSIIPRVCVDGRSPVEGSEPNDSVVGGHDDEHGLDGCGAQKRLPDILGYMRDRGGDLREEARKLGVEVDDETHALITRSAGALLDEGYADPGAEIRAAYIETAGEQSVTKLAGDHHEVLGNVNTNKQKTLNRRRLADEFGDDYQAFEVDAGVFPDAAAVISLTEEEVQQKVVAMVYYNLATTFVLAHESLALTTTH